MCQPFRIAGRRMFQLVVHSSLFVVKVKLISELCELENWEWIDT